MNILQEDVILIKNDVVLSCCLKPIVYPVSLTDKQRYRLQ